VRSGSGERILCGVALAFAAEVFAESDVEHPMQFVFNAPVLADDAVQLCGIGWRLVM